ncbi:MAG: hypothetical protein HY323_01030 [Betaproteobacteria bacterium]|nr:hypothetical protein [Betaproteobacteria bacterium]
MAFSTLSTALFLTQEGDLQSGVGAWWQYCSSDAAADISGTTGYFKAVGAGGISSRVLGMKIGDIVVNIESTGGVTPGRVSLHSVVSSTADGSTVGSTYGYDCSVSAAATT